jgi:hypothetical protein
LPLADAVHNLGAGTILAALSAIVSASWLIRMRVVM